MNANEKVPRYCSGCGKSLSDDARFCAQCGAPVEIPAQVQSSLNPQPDLPHAPAMPPEKKKNGNDKYRILTIVILCVMVVSIGILAVRLIPGSEESGRKRQEGTGLNKADDISPANGESFTHIPDTEPESSVATEETVPDSPLAGTYEITMWVSETDGVAAQFQEQVARFNEENTYGITIVASIEGVSEYDTGSKVLCDVATAPDLYCFAQDQLARLVQADALAAPSTDACTTISESNDSSAVAAASVGGTIYAYPMTSDNGYYLYYDTSVVSDPDSLEAIIADCEASGKLFRFSLENAWYTVSFFFATGCYSNWTMDTDGNFTSVDDNFNSDAGLIAMKGMQKLATSSCYDSNADIFTDCAAIVTGIWNANAAAEHFGDNLGVADLPSFEVDGTSYHLGSYSGNKLIGVKPQNDPAKAAVLSQLAQYLTNEQCQLERYELCQWVPSNKAAQASEAVQVNPSLAALAAQNEYGQPQSQIHGSWWDIAKLLGAYAKAAASEDDLKTALAEYEEAINALFQRYAN